MPGAEAARLRRHRRGRGVQHPFVEMHRPVQPHRVVHRDGKDTVVAPRQPVRGDDRVEHRGVGRVHQRRGVQHRVVGHGSFGLHPDPVVGQLLPLVAHHPGRIVGVTPVDRPQRVDEMRHDVLVPAQKFVNRGHRLGVGQLRRFDAVLDATTAGQIGDHRRGQQLAVLHHVDPAVGEAAFVAQPHHVELEVFFGVAARDEVRRDRARR